MKCFPPRQIRRLRLFAFALTGLPGAAMAASVPTTATNTAPLVMTTADRVPWSNLAELERFAERGDPKACAQLGEQLLRGDGIAQNIRRALTLLERAARGGIGSAAFRLGMVYDDGQGVAQDRLLALAYFRAAAAAGEAEAFFNIGAAYVGAHGVKRDYVEGLAWLILASKRGAGGDTEQTVRTRIQKLRHPEWITAAEQRAPVIARELAATTVGALLPASAPTNVGSVAPGLAPTPSRPTALALNPYLPAPVLPAQNFRPEPPAIVAEPPSGPLEKLILPTGRRVNYSDLASLQRAADHGEPGAAAALGQILLAGQLTPAEPERAIVILEQAARAGSADAAHLLAELYTNGDKVPRDDAKAFAYNLQAARGGSLQAMFNTGALYANGRGTARDYTAALAWLIVAKHYKLDQGGAEKRIRAHVEKTAPAQIAVAEKRAAELQREIEAVIADPKRP